jgi:hypothetical protein
MFNCPSRGDEAGCRHAAPRRCRPVRRAGPGWLRTVAGECERAAKELEDYLHDSEAELLAAHRDR